ncbi:MAG: MaoC family dehydratase [Chloroflexi bacterium]|nr:MaoC family dehydratase [Chloroflexota bacterium]
MLWQEGQELAAVNKAVTQEQILRYAHASGDMNPVHLDPEFAAQGPFGQIVAHGMLALAFLSEMLAGAFGRPWAESGRLKVRFRAPVYPGDTVTAYGRITKLTNQDVVAQVQCTVGCRKADGQEVITGDAFVTIVNP